MDRPSHTPDVSVVIVNYNGLAFLPGCLDSLHRAFSRFTHEVIVVDNASSDGSQAWLSDRSDIRYIALPDNTGFTGGNNVGVGAATGKVVLLLNNDTLLQTPLDDMIAQAMAPYVGAVGCRLQYGDGRQQFSVGLDHHALRVVLSWLGLEKRHRLPSVFRRLETDPAFYLADHASVPWVSGAVLATPRALWLRLGGLDEAFFMYCEDVDYCKRVRDAGFRVAYDSSVLVTHFEGAGKAWIGPAALLRTVRAYFIYLEKHAGVQRARLCAAGLATVFALRSMAFAALTLLTKADTHKATRRMQAKGFASACKSMAIAAVRGQRPTLP